MAERALTSQHRVYDITGYDESLNSGKGVRVINRMHRRDSPSQARFGSGDLEVALLDLDEALRNLGGDEDLLCEIAKVFVDDVPALARDLKSRLINPTIAPPA
ncbi:MAG: hypothetical protein U0892_13585 [Pirellulales bacterium]